MKHLFIISILMFICTNLWSQDELHFQLSTSRGMNYLGAPTMDPIQAQWPEVSNSAGWAYEIEGRLAFRFSNKWGFGFGYTFQQYESRLSLVEQRPDSYFWTRRTDDLSIYKSNSLVTFNIGYQLFQSGAWSIPLEIGYSVGFLQQSDLLHEVSLDYRFMDDAQYPSYCSEYTENNSFIYDLIQSPFAQIGLQYDWNRISLKAFFRYRHQYHSKKDRFTIKYYDTFGKDLINFFEENSHQEQFFLGVALGIRFFNHSNPSEEM